MFVLKKNFLLDISIQPYEKRRSEKLVESKFTSQDFCSNTLLLSNVFGLSNLGIYSYPNGLFQESNSTLSQNENQCFNISDYVDPEPLAIHGPSDIIVNCLQEMTVPGIKEENNLTIESPASVSTENVASELENINIDFKTEDDNSPTSDTSMEQDEIQNISEKRCKRTIFISSEEDNYADDPNFIHFLRTTKTFHQKIDKNSNNDLPRKKVTNSWDSLESVVYVKNETIESAFTEMKKKFARDGKVDKYGKVPELLLFHGTSIESINKIIEDNFVIDKNPAERSKVMLFGRGVYLSELPGVSLMYGESLLLCKVILGKCQKYYPNGQTPPPIPDGFDSRIVIKDGLEVVTVVKNASQILPYSIVNIKDGRIVQAGTLRSSQQDQQQHQCTNKVNTLAQG